MVPELEGLLFRLPCGKRMLDVIGAIKRPILCDEPLHFALFVLVRLNPPIQHGLGFLGGF